MDVLYGVLYGVIYGVLYEESCMTVLFFEATRSPDAKWILYGVLLF